MQVIQCFCNPVFLKCFVHRGLLKIKFSSLPFNIKSLMVQPISPKCTELSLISVWDSLILLHFSSWETDFLASLILNYDHMLLSLSHFTEKPIFKTVRPKIKRNWQINEAAQYETVRQSIFPGAVRKRSVMQDYAEIRRRIFSSCNIFLSECYFYKCHLVLWFH